MILEICGSALVVALTTRFYVDSVYFKSKRILPVLIMPPAFALGFFGFLQYPF